MACSRDRGSELTVLLDTTPPRRVVEALFLPADPATIGSLTPARSAALRPSTADSVARYERLADSIEQLDRSFQQLRDSLNREARALDAVDRRSRAYAERFFAFRRRKMEAEGMRHARDRLRSRAATMRGRLAATLHARERSGSDDTRRRRGALDSLVADTRRARAVPLSAGTMTGSLEPGVWWVGIAPQGGLPDRFERVVLRRGARDTLRFSGDVRD
jgi:hypothetical protein